VALVIGTGIVMRMGGTCLGHPIPLYERKQKLQLLYGLLLGDLRRA
jgi:hypothetical protein